MSNQIYSRGESSSSVLFDLPWGLGPSGNGTNNKIRTNDTTDSASYTDTSASISTLGGLSVAKTLSAGAVLLPTTGGTASPLNFAGKDTFIFNMVCGDGAPSANITGTCVRIGEMIFFNLPNFTVTSGATTSSIIVSNSGAIPPAYRPASNLMVGVTRITDAGTTYASPVYILSTGQIQIYKNAAGDTYTGSAALTSPLPAEMRWLYNV